MTTEPTTEARLRATIAKFTTNIEQFDDLSKVNLVRDLGFDSLDMIELVMLIEDDLGIEITDAETEPFMVHEGEVAPDALAQIVALIDAKLAAQAGAVQA